MAGDPVIEVGGLVIEYGRGRNRRRAVDGISFSIQPGECVGFIGANGAGKSSTIKTLMGFLFPAAGEVRVFGETAGTPQSRARIGYLPEVALYYPFMKARELLELYGGLGGLSRGELRDRIPGLLAQVGLDGRGETLLRNFSKGMQQRLGIAQALIAQPELLIFDEMSSGLDPLGRHDLRNVLLGLKRAGRTIFFSSHELTEVESLCDRVIIIHRGRVVRSSPVRELMAPLNRYEILFQATGAEGLPGAVKALGPERRDDGWLVATGDVAAYADALHALASAACPVTHTASRNRSLEDYFIDIIRGSETGAN